jgi:hypothetical protein
MFGGGAMAPMASPLDTPLLLLHGALGYILQVYSHAKKVRRVFLLTR